MKTSYTLIKKIRALLFAGCGIAYGSAGGVAQNANTAPTATAQTVSVIKNKENVPITLAGTDADGDALTFEVLTQPAQGTLAGTAPNLTYTPKLDYYGSDSFIFKVNDGKADSQPATVSINVALSPGKTLHCWWGDFNTNDYNPNNSLRVIINPKTKKAIPNLDYIDPDGNNTPEPPSREGYFIDDKVSNTRRKISAWVHRFPRENDPMQMVGGVGGGNRTVFWDPQKAVAKSPAYREVEGYFAEPDISGVDLDRSTNKPTCYFGVMGTLSTDCGIQWEPKVFNDNGTLKVDEGWTLINRITTGIGAVATDTGVKKGRWEIFGQFKMPGETFARRFKAGSLRTVHMRYVLDRSNVGTISLSNNSEFALQYCSPQQPVTVTSLRRNAGLTQGVTAEEIGNDIENPKDGNVKKLSNALVYLDGSVLKGLKFGGGKLKTVAPSKPTDPAQITTPWEQAGNNNELKPPDRVDDKFIVDFTEISGSNPLTKPRNPAQDWLTNYQTNFRTEDVIITMGKKKKRHKVERVPKKRKS